LTRPGALAAGALALAALAPALAEPHSPAPSLEGARVLHREAPAEEAARLRREADDLARRLAQSRSQVLDLLDELSRLDRERAVAEKRARAADLEAELAHDAFRAAEERARRLDERHADARRRIGLVLSALHREGERAEWKRLAEGAAGRADDGAVDAAVGAAMRHEALRRELAAASAAARSAEAEAGARRAELEEARAGRRAALAELETRRERRSRRLTTLRGETSRLGLELAAAEAGLQGLLQGVPASATVPPDAPTSAVAAARGLDGLRGRLPWPLGPEVRGRLLERFGEVVHPRHGTRTVRHGVLVEAPAGAPIRAVAPGRVVFGDWYKGFGLALVVDHGGGDLSVLAHAGELLVRVGEPVEAGRVVATVGDTGSLRGPCLYFQLQRDGTPVDPMAWLAR
jgi:septal ring factor EnvC (AmiA/AmiB activator)